MSAESLVDVATQSTHRFSRPPPAPVAPEALGHRELRSGRFGNASRVRHVSEAEFLDHQWQAKHSITNIPKLLATLEGLVSSDIVRDAENGFHHAPMPCACRRICFRSSTGRSPTKIPFASSSSPFCRAGCPTIPRWI